MVFQDPMSSLDPRQSVESLLVEGMKAHGLASDKAATHARLRELLDGGRAAPGGAAKYPHEFSGGQRQRIGIARALCVDPKLIVADEPVSALDVSVQAQVLNLLEELQDEFGLTYLVIAHDLAVVRHISDRIGVMYLGGHGRGVGGRRALRQPLHPYTRALMSAVPVPDPVVEDQREQILLTGDLPSPSNPPTRLPVPHPLPVAAADPLRRPSAPSCASSRSTASPPTTGSRATGPSRSRPASSQAHEVDGRADRGAGDRRRDRDLPRLDHRLLTTYPVRRSTWCTKHHRQSSPSSADSMTG